MGGTELVPWISKLIFFIFIFQNNTKDICLLTTKKKSTEQSPIVRHCARFRGHTWFQRWLFFCSVLISWVVYSPGQQAFWGIQNKLTPCIVWKTPALWKAVLTRVSSHASFPRVGVWPVGLFRNVLIQKAKRLPHSPSLVVGPDCSWTSCLGGSPSNLLEASGKGKWHHSDWCGLTECITCEKLLSSWWHPAV